MEKHPNVLWLFSDEHRAQAMSCAGDSNIETPHLDQLAHNGCRYQRAYSTAPLCSPFRACLLTGKYMSEHGVTSLHIPLINQTLISETMQKYVYRTSYYGKWHISGGAAPSHFVSKYFYKGFDEFIGWENSNEFFNTKYFKDTDKNPQQYRTMKKYQSDELTDLALKGLEENIAQHKPWFQIVSYEAPHPPAVRNKDDLNEYLNLYAPEEYLNLYKSRKIELRENVFGSKEELETARQRLKGYYAAIKNLDDNIGRIYHFLLEKGELNNTIIFYFADHGDLFGSHGRYGKARAEEESSNIPLIIHWPDGIRPHEINDKLFAGIDIAPTMFGLLDLPVPSYVSGMDLSHQLREKEGSDRESVLIQHDRAFFSSDQTKTRFRSLVELDYKYIFYQESKREVLFHIKTDPYEICDLSEKEEYKNIKNELKRKLMDHLYAIQDDFVDCMY